MKDLVIDVHAHFIPTLLYERFDAKAFPNVKFDEKAKRMQFPGAEQTRPISPKLSDLNDRRAWMDQNGIDHQLLGGWLDIFGYELAAGEGLAWSRFYNQCMREQLKAEPRFTPLASVPLQDGKLAAQVLREAPEQGFGGVMIGTLPRGNAGNLDDPSLDAFWSTAAELEAAVFLHPMFLCGEPRLADYDLVNAIGRLADSSIAVSRLLFSGHLLKFPGMKLVLSHGGAALPYALGRLARNHAISQGKYADPRKGFEAMYFDSTPMRSNSWRARRRPSASCSAPTCRFPSAIHSLARWSKARASAPRRRSRFSGAPRSRCFGCGPTVGARADALLFGEVPDVIRSAEHPVERVVPVGGGAGAVHVVAHHAGHAVGGVKDQPQQSRGDLHARRAHQPRLLIFQECLWKIAVGRVGAHAQAHRILHRHGRALREVLQHEVRRIAEQRHRSVAPVIHRIAEAQHPAPEFLGHAHQVHRLFAVMREERQHFLRRSLFVVPAGGVLADHRGDEVEKFPAAQRVVDDVGVVRRP
jgi:aminocarboxymuconate-semialdehyde decarboxylase